MRKREFERLLVSLGGLSPAQLRHVSQKVGSLNERREVQDLTDKRVEALGACPHCGTVVTDLDGEPVSALELEAEETRRAGETVEVLEW